MATTKLKLLIGGAEYSIITDDDPAYVREIGKLLDSTIDKIAKDSPRLSSTQVAVLAALSFADESRKAGGDADRLRSQIKDYLDDASNAKGKADKARHDLENAKKYIESLEKENAKLRSELEKK